DVGRSKAGPVSPHWLRDILYREDHSSAHTRSGPPVMAALRNLAIGAIRLTGRRDITEATHAAARDMHRPFKILKLPSAVIPHAGICAGAAARVVPTAISRRRLRFPPGIQLMRHA